MYVRSVHSIIRTYYTRSLTTLFPLSLSPLAPPPLHAHTSSLYLYARICTRVCVYLQICMCLVLKQELDGIWRGLLRCSRERCF